MTLEQLRVLVTVARSGSFTAAAELLGTQKSHVSRVVSQLEAELGVKLMERTTRSLSVTEAGTEIVERAVGILAAVQDTTRMAQNLHGEPRGTLRLTCGTEFGMLAVIGWIGEYLEAFPKAAVDAEYTSRVLDVVHEGFDLAIRVGKIDESRLVARHLGDIDYGLFACPRYLAAQGTPAAPEALREHRLVMFSGGQMRRGWTLRPADAKDAVRIEGPARLLVNHSFAVRDALLRSLGIGMLPLLVAQDALSRGRLVPVLPECAVPSMPVHAVYPSNRYLSPKVRAFIDLALARFPSASSSARRAHERACAARSALSPPAPPPPRAPSPRRKSSAAR